MVFITKPIQVHGLLHDSCIVIVRTGHDQYYGDVVRYMGAASMDDYKHLNELGWPDRLHWPVDTWNGECATRTGYSVEGEGRVHSLRARSLAAKPFTRTRLNGSSTTVAWPPLAVTRSASTPAT